MATWCAKWRIKPNPEKTKVIIFSMSLLARKAELNLTLYGEPLKIYLQEKFLGIIFDSKLTFQKHFEDILERCNNRYYRLRLLANKKWGPSPATLIQIYKQCVRPIFEYGSLSTTTVSDNIISKIQRLQNNLFGLVHVPNFEGVARSEDFACATLPTTPLNFQGRIRNFCHPTLLNIRFKVIVTPLPSKNGQSKKYGVSINSNCLLTL